ncbi:hypothetical protein ACWDTP_38250 [Mycobacterium sp. NPDC003449]
MTKTIRFIAPLLAAGALATAVAAAPAAMARSCEIGGAATVCQSPGNVEIHTGPSHVSAPRIYGPFTSPLWLLGN